MIPIPFDVLFWSKIKFVRSCWIWSGQKNSNGYGMFLHRRKGYLPHRVSFRKLVGEIPPKMVLDHLCQNRLCVNPAHLEVVTRSVNQQRAFSRKFFVKQCKNGHNYDATNTTVMRNSLGYIERRCYQCRKKPSN